MPTFEWYEALTRPSWAPPSSVFGPVWSVLYFIIFLSFGFVLGLFVQKKISKKVIAPFALNIVFNVLFSPIQFGLQNNFLAAIDIVLVLGTLVWALWAIYPHAKWVTVVNIPYLLWVCFATVLQLSITVLNW